LRSEHDLAQSLRNPRKFDEASRELKGLKVRVQTPNGQVSIRNSYLRNFRVVICCVEPISVKRPTLNTGCVEYDAKVSK